MELNGASLHKPLVSSPLVPPPPPRESLVAIQEWTKVAITTKGAYYPPGRNPPAGERKLYLLIEGESEAAVKMARKEMRRILEEQAAISAPDDSNTNRYAKYTV